MTTEGPHATTPPPESASGGPAPTHRASGGRRALAALLALALAFGAAVMIAVAVDIGDTPTCEDLLASIAAGECFDGGSAQKTISVALLWVSGALGALAALLGLAVAFTGRFGGRFGRVAVAAVVAGALALLIGSI